MSFYYTGILLNEVPTGFGFYTGFVLTNGGNFPVEYEVSISKTDLTGISSADVIGGEVPDKTIFISDSLENKYVDEDFIKKTLNQNDSETFYILHRPFSNYTDIATKHTGYESGIITIKTKSILNTLDNDIIIAVSGQRIFTQPTPKKIGKFYAVTDYQPDSKVNIQYNWSVIDSENYLTGFRIETYKDASFTNLQSEYEYIIPENTNVDDPLYGTYNSFSGQNYTYTLKNLEVSQNYFARISGLNTNNSGAKTFATGFIIYNPVLDNTAYSGLTPSPGTDLKFEYRILNLNKISENETDFDLMNFLYENNNNSYDFTKYSGAIVNFFPKTNLQARYLASNTTKGAINFIVPNDKNFSFSTDGTNIFKMQLEFENVSLRGFGGAGATMDANGQNGGCVFNLAKIPSQDGEKKINYYIYKDNDSSFLVGIGGGKSSTVEVSTNKSIPKIQIQGGKIDYVEERDIFG